MIDARPSPEGCALPGDPVLPGEGAEWVPPTWDEVVREHADRVYRLAYRLTGNQHDAEDLTQETFVRVFRSLASYRPGTFEGWLHRITTNLFLDMVRRRSRMRMEALPEDSERIPGAGPEPEQVFSDTHLDPVLQSALHELAPEFRAAVVLCDVEGLSYEEIGATLGVKLGTVRSRIHRGRAALRAALERQRVQTSVGGRMEAETIDAVSASVSERRGAETIDAVSASVSERRGAETIDAVSASVSERRGAETIDG